MGPTCLKAQIQHGGEPIGPSLKSEGDLPFITIPSVNEEKLLREDSIAKEKGKKVLRFAKNFTVDIDPYESGRIDTLRDGRRVLRLGIRSEDARALAFGFEPYQLQEKAKLFIYTPGGKKVIGSFTRAEAIPEAGLATVPLKGDELIIELIEPADSDKRSEIGLKRVSHAYRSLSFLKDQTKREFSDAGDCNMNVNCPDGKPWRRQKRSVAMIIANGNRVCSGALVNNTAEDGTPYFLTADHCLDQSGSPSGWNFIFNYESPDCQDQQSSLDQSISGADLKANHEDSDFALVELVDTPPSSYEVFYAGWDRSGNTPDSSFSIHHPSGDIKKIAFDDDQASSGQFGNSIPNGEWHIEDWDRNTTTETGSSGGPLFDEKGRTIGQLHGGSAECGNNVDDYFGKFSVSWDQHAAKDSQLKHWLDPVGSNPMKWRGYDPRVGEYDPDAAITAILQPERILCKDPSFDTKVEFQNQGSQELDSLRLYLVLDQDTLEERKWSGKLASGDYDTLNFSSHTVSEGGAPSLLVGSRKPNGQTDPDPSDDTLSIELEHREKGRNIELKVQTDCYGIETGWSIHSEDGDSIDGRGPGFYPGTENSPEEGGVDRSHSVCLVQGCYKLKVKDRYGDGMKGSQYQECNVDGSMEVLGENGDLLAELEDPEFGEDTTIQFCTDSSIEVQIPEEKEIQLFPNPSNGSFHLRFKGISGKYSLKLFDLRGRKLFQRRIQKEKAPFSGWIDLPNIRSGAVYILELEGPTESYRKKLFIDR